MRLKKLRRLLLILLLGLTIALPPAFSQPAPPNGLQLVDRAQQEYESSRYQEAIPLLQQAAAQFAAQQDRFNQATALSNLAAVHGQLGEWEQANQAVSLSLTLLAQPQTPQQQRILAQTLDIQGQLQLQQGRSPAALDSWTQAAAGYRSIADRDRLLQAQINQSQALQALGLYPRACKTLLAALQLAAETCEVAPQAIEILQRQPDLPQLRGINALGHVLRVLGQLTESKQLLILALQQAQRLGATQEAAVAALHLGNTIRAVAAQPGLFAQRDVLERSALSYYQQAAQIPSSETGLQAQLNALSLQVSRREPIVLPDSLQPDRFPPGRAGLMAKLNLAQSLLDLTLNGSTTPVDLDLLVTQAVQQANQLGDPRLQAYALSSQSRYYELQQRWEPAESIANQALSLAPPFRSPDIAYQVLWQIGRLHKAQGKFADAIGDYSQAVDVLSALRGDLVAVNPQVQFSFRDSVEPIYRQLVELLLLEESPSQNNLRQARQVIESLQLAELDNFFRDACADAKPRSIDEIDRTAAVFYPIVLKDSFTPQTVRLDVILAIPGQPLRHYKIRRAELEQTIQQARDSLRRTAFPQERLPIAQQLYDWLIRPADAALAENKIQTLVFVLDGYLRNLPIAVLHDGQQYLIEKYAVALSSGLQLLEPQPIADVRLQVLVGALSDARQGFPPLPAVAQEVEQIAAQVPTRTLLNEQFQRQTLQQRIAAAPAPIVHLATHGQFSSDAAQTFLLTWNEQINVKQLDRLLRTQARSLDRETIELLVLSACETAAGDDRAALGLAGVAIRSGARSILATLWNVNDASTAVFMAQFYRELAQPGTSKAAALRRAQLALLRDRQYQHPYFWAPFVLVGNWQ